MWALISPYEKDLLHREGTNTIKKTLFNFGNETCTEKGFECFLSGSPCFALVDIHLFSVVSNDHKTFLENDKL